MKQKHWKILSLLMLVMTIGFSVAAFMGHSDAIPTAMMCTAATLVTFAAAKRIE